MNSQINPNKNNKNKESQPTILIMAGGTGGHVMPALAVAKALIQKNYKVHWLGTQKGLEAKLVPQNDIPISYISISGLRGKGWQSLLLAPFKIIRAIFQSYKIIKAIQPRAVLSMGGYVAGPGGIAAFLTRTPILIHEQNAISGLTNRLLAPFAKIIMTAFPNVFPKRFDNKIHQTGNPILDSFICLPTPSERFSKREGNLRLLVIGGSLGALGINTLVPKTISMIPKDWRPEIIHQTGLEHFDRVEKMYQTLGLQAKLEPFINNMAKAYDWADVVISRAGALTIAEIAAAGVTSILIPFPQAVDDHQTKNAEYLSQEEAAFLLPQKDLTPEILSKHLMALIQNSNLRLKMATSCRKLAQLNATQNVVGHCLEVSGE